jgi:hypothetical protein
MHNCMFRNQSSGHAQVIFMLRVLVSEQGLKEGKSDFNTKNSNDPCPLTSNWSRQYHQSTRNR